ncbi:MAG: hypothetical protein ACLS3C_03900 [Oscillospiraceae bacterium]
MNFYSPVTDRLRAELAQDSVVSARLDYSQRSSKLDRLRAGGASRALTGRLRRRAGQTLAVMCCILRSTRSARPKLDASAVFLGEVDGMTCSRCTTTA